MLTKEQILEFMISRGAHFHDTNLKAVCDQAALAVDLQSEVERLKTSFISFIKYLSTKEDNPYYGVSEISIDILTEPPKE